MRTAAVVFALLPGVLSLSACVQHVKDHLDGDRRTATPVVNFSPDEPRGALAVESAVASADWSRLTVAVHSCKGSNGPVVYVGGARAASHVNMAASAASRTAVSSAAAASGCAEGAQVRATPASTKLFAGDFLAFCANTADVREVHVVMTDTVSNAVVYTYTFVSVPTCA